MRFRTSSKPARSSWFLWLGLALMAAIGSAGCIVSIERPKNLLLISIDTLNRDALRFYSQDAGVALPNLEAFAERALIFENAVSPASWTLPAHASLLTGLYPDRHGAVHGSVKIGPEVPTLASPLQAAGFETVGLSDGGFLSGAYGFEKGFDRYESSRNDPLGGVPAPPTEGDGDEDLDRNLFAKAIEFLSTRGEGAEPFFLFMHTYSVHNYFKLRSWALEDGREYASADHYQRCVLGKQICSEEDWQTLRDLYVAELKHFDTAFGRLMHSLDSTGLSDNTLIVFVSDHGEGFSPDRGRIHHGGRLHADVLRVPFLVAGPGVEGGRSEELVSLVDVAATLLEVAVTPSPHQPQDAQEGLRSFESDGRSFVSALRGEALSDSRSVYGMEHAFVWKNGQRYEASEALARPVGIAVVGDENWYVGSMSGGEELYARADDAVQAQNLAESSPALAEQRSLSVARNDFVPPVDRLADDPQLIEQLRALGYLDDPQLESVPAAPAP